MNDDRSGGRAAGVLVAGGTGERLGVVGGKQMISLAGRPMLSYAVEAFDRAQSVGLLVVVCHPERVDEYRALAVEPYCTATPVVMVAGGDRRQDSVANGLAAVGEDPAIAFVAVHDGARPLVTAQLIDEVVERLGRDPGIDGLVVGHPSYDTLKIVHGDRVVETPDRSRYWAAQTPQVFRVDSLKRAYAEAALRSTVATDDASLVEALGGVVRMHPGPRENIKITVAEDVPVAEAVLARRTKAGA